MPPRFMERMQKQSDVYKKVFGEPQFDPPPYPVSRGRSDSTFTAGSASSSQAYTTLNKELPSPPPLYRASESDILAGFEKSAIPKDSLILVTGANGYLGMHVVDQLLLHGYRVRGAIRTTENAVSTADYFTKKYGPARFTPVIVPDMVPQGAYDAAVRDCVGMVHLASVSTFSADPNEVITPSIAGTLNALESADKESSVKRFVYCSASAAAVVQDSAARSEVTSDSWNMSDFKTAWEPPPYEVDRAWAVWASSKMQTEQAVWRWYRQRRSYFVLNTVLPSTLLGPPLSPPTQPAHSDVPPRFLLSDHALGSLKQTFTHVSDVAALHLAALLLPDVKSQRILACSNAYSSSAVIDVLKKMYPGRDFDGMETSGTGEGPDADGCRFIEAPRAEELLKRMGRREGWRTGM